MAWSTSELAALAGTTVNTIRHYHRLGLLEEPDRRYNGYKQYQVRHLVRLLRIRRLVDLGVPLGQIDEVEAGGDGAPDALRELDAELASGIDRLQRAREAIAAILRGEAPADVPPGFEEVASRLSDADSSMIHIYGRVYDEEAMDDIRKMVESDPEPLTKELNALQPDADEATRQRLAEELGPVIAQYLREYAWLSDPTGRLEQATQWNQETFTQAVVELYNEAQRDVLARAATLAAELRKADEEGTEEGAEKGGGSGA